MLAVNRERKHNSNPMGKRKHWYVPCIAPALAALLLAGCGATVDLNEQATAETAMAVQWVPNGSGEEERACRSGWLLCLYRRLFSL